MPRTKAVKPDALATSPTPRKRSAVKSTEAASPTVETKIARTAPARKKVAVAADIATVATVTHRHKKQDTTHIRADAPVVSTQASAAFEPNHEDVAKLAYSYYVARGYQAGNQAEDWFRAVVELKQRHSSSDLKNRD